MFIGLTTPLGQDNEVTKLFNTKDKNGEVIIASIRIGKPCDDCRAKRILCVHAENATGEGLSKKKRERFQNFYKGEEHIAMREFQGETSDDARILFQQEWLLSLARNTPFKVRGPVDVIMVSIDPAQGGQCEWGFCACIYDVINNSQIIVQMDACRISPATPSEIKRWLLRSLQSLRARHPAFTEPPILIACESAPKVITEMIAEQVQELINVGTVYNTYLMLETPDERPGVPKNSQNTQDMVRYCQNLMENGKVHFANVFGTSVLGKDKVDVLCDFFTQIGNVKIRYEDTNRPDGVMKARIDGKSGGRNDDLAVAWLMNYYWYLEYMLSKKPAYLDIKQQSSHWRAGHVTIPGFTIDHLRRKQNDTLPSTTDLVHAKRIHDREEYEAFDGQTSMGPATVPAKYQCHTLGRLDI